MTTIKKTKSILGLKQRLPIVVVDGFQTTLNQEYDVHDPPNTQTPQRQQFPDPGAHVTQAKPVHAEEPQQNRIQKGSDEIMSVIPNTRISVLEKFSVSRTFDALKRVTADLGFLHVLVSVAAPFGASVTQLVASRLVICERGGGNKQ